MSEENYSSKTESYYLPSDVSAWITEQAKVENRSESNFLTTLLRRIRDTTATA